jgi:hypothetical protein
MQIDLTPLLKGYGVHTSYRITTSPRITLP